MKFNLLLLLVIFVFQVNAQIVIVDNPPDLPLDDAHSKTAGEADRFNTNQYYYGANHFTITETMELDNAIFYGEKDDGSYDDIGAFSVYIMESNSNNQPDLNPRVDSVFVHLEKILPEEGVEVLYENNSDEMEIGMDFTLANQGIPVVLPPGDYWLIAARYIEDDDVATPLSKWSWRYSTNVSTHKLQVISHNDPTWEEIWFNDYSSLAWKLTANVVTNTFENQLDSEVSVYPNPTNGILNFEVTNDIEVTKVSLYEISGTRIKSEKPSNSFLDISNLHQGIYLLELQTTKGTIHRKISKI